MASGNKHHRTPLQDKKRVYACLQDTSPDSSQNRVQIDAGPWRCGPVEGRLSEELLVWKFLARRKLVEREVIEREVIEREVIEREVIERVIEREVMEREVIEREVIGREVIGDFEANSFWNGVGRGRRGSPSAEVCQQVSVVAKEFTKTGRIIASKANLTSPIVPYRLRLPTSTSWRYTKKEVDDVRRLSEMCDGTACANVTSA
ncbi:hypothetical protein GE09DRAFT_1276785 [Coniochaeta sp. 2T2.1]|nr:hypothetical protein GE09DRAFT_1276785 [Coniochaeta sp. 2T2.1]